MAKYVNNLFEEYILERESYVLKSKLDSLLSVDHGMDVTTIFIDGIDASGKETTCNSLKEKLMTNDNTLVMMVSLPDYSDEETGNTIHGLLRIKRTFFDEIELMKNMVINRFNVVKSMIGAINNIEDKTQKIYVIFDRSPISNLAYMSRALVDENIGVGEIVSPNNILYKLMMDEMDFIKRILQPKNSFIGFIGYDHSVNDKTMTDIQAHLDVLFNKPDKDLNEMSASLQKHASEVFYRLFDTNVFGGIAHVFHMRTSDIYTDSSDSLQKLFTFLSC